MSHADDPSLCTGSCLCGAIRYRAGGPLEQMVHCHCGMCRKAHGSAFATFVSAPSAGFEWLAGREHLRSYQSSPPVRRWFCGICGSVAPAPVEGERAWMPAGNLSGDCGARPVAHMFTDSRAPWVTIRDDLPRFPAAPPGYEAPALGRGEPPPRPPGTITGGCLCGRVRYQIHGEPLVMVNCHCSRCRRARSAAHATNLFVLPEQLVWTAGEDSVTVYDLPGAERFGVNFCPDCGGPVPRSSPKIGRVNVPAGSLDGDPRVVPSRHIFIGSKAPWFDILDDLPAYQEAAR